MKGKPLATAKPTKYLVKKIPIISRSGIQLPGIVKLLLFFENVTCFGYANFTPINNVNMKPIIQNPIAKEYIPKTDKTPKIESVIIEKGNMKTVFTFTTRFLL